MVDEKLKTYDSKRYERERDVRTLPNECLSVYSNRLRALLL